MSNSHILLDRAKAGQLNPNMLGVDASLAVAVYFRLPRYVYFARLDRIEINEQRCSVIKAMCVFLSEGGVLLCATHDGALFELFDKEQSGRPQRHNTGLRRNKR